MTRILIHVQHLLGTGHTRRAAAIAAACAARGAETTLLAGGPPIAGLDVGGARLVQLPPLMAADARFQALIEPDGTPVDDAFRARRRDRVLDAFDRARPEVLVTEMYPFGRRQLEFELGPLVARGQERGARLICSLRDVIAAKTPARDAAMVARGRLYERILVHGDAAWLALDASFPAAAAAADRIAYTGYIANPPGPAAPAGDGVDEIVVSVGGGRVGAKLVEAAITASRGSPWRWRVLADAPPTRTGNLIVEPPRRDFPGLLARARASVSQAGYNTVVDILAAGVRAVLVPFAAEGEREQTIRAQALARSGRAALVDEGELTAARLTAALAQVLDRPVPPLAVRLDGAAESARMILS